jgi:sugar lactone lactonase YvrE
VEGAQGPAQTVLSLADDVGLPDGLAIDAEGCLWLAIWGAGCILRVRTDGTPLQRLDLAEPNVTSCAFAGPALGQLAVTTAADVAGGRPGGHVHLVDVGVPGCPRHRFGARGGAA